MGKSNNDIPQVALRDIDKQTYIKKLAEAEQKINVYKNIARSGMNNTIRQCFSINGDCFQIFDKRAGGILFKDWEWEMIPNTNKLKELFESREYGSYQYSIETDEGKMLRGVDTYYFFLANKDENKDISEKLVAEWGYNNIEFLNQILIALPITEKTNTNDRRLLLAALDNIRNISLLMLNVNIVKNVDGRNTLLGLSGQMGNPEIKNGMKIVNL